VSRAALAEVRAAVEGYRGLGLTGELRNGVRALESAGVRLEATIADIRMPARVEGVLALALREALTNVVRHARATHCRVSLARRGSAVALTVSDDGAGGSIVEGMGLSGMRDRVTAIGGTVTVASGPGVTVSIAVPDVRDETSKPGPA
jgi:two-component system, NarL family, sensor histidine kinase DesK